MDHIARFHEVARAPNDYARQWKDRHKAPVIGLLCSYAPEEIIAAAGALGFRIFGSKAGISKAGAHLQAYSCSLVRGVLEDALAGRLDFLDGAVFPHTCDSIQRLSDIWRLNTDFRFFADMVLPVKLTTDSARQYLYDVLQTFKKTLEKGLEVTVSDPLLREAIGLCNAVRLSLAELYALRSRHPGLIRGKDVLAVVEASMIMDKKEFLQHIKALLTSLEDAAPLARTCPGTRVILSGGICTHPDIYGIIEDAGAVAVWDDLCTGTRYFETMMEPDAENPVAAIACRLFRRPICPAKHRGLWERGAYLLDLVQKHSANAVILVHLKFCDPHAFDYPYLKDYLGKHGIPVTVVEMEDGFSGGGQLRTRLEAFLEML